MPSRDLTDVMTMITMMMIMMTVAMFCRGFAINNTQNFLGRDQ